MHSELPLSQGVGGLAAMQGTGQVGLVGCALEPTPWQPLGLCLIQGVCIRSAGLGGCEQTEVLPRHQLPQLQNHQLQGRSSAHRDLPAPSLSPSPACTKGPLRFLPLFPIPARSHPLEAGPTAFSGGCSSSAPRSPALQQLRVLRGELAPSPSCSRAPSITLPWFPNPPSTAQPRGVPAEGGKSEFELRGWAQGLLQELLNLYEVCFQLLVEQQEGWVGAWR